MSKGVKRGQEGPKLTPRQLRGLEALLTSGTIRGASYASGIPVRTLKRWLSQENFRQALAEAEKEVLSEIKWLLLGNAQLALLELEGILADGDTRVRLRAADIVLSKFLQALELMDLQERLERLEQAVAELRQ